MRFCIADKQEQALHAEQIQSTSYDLSNAQQPILKSLCSTASAQQQLCCYCVVFCASRMLQAGFIIYGCLAGRGGPRSRQPG